MRTTPACILLAGAALALGACGSDDGGGGSSSSSSKAKSTPAAAASGGGGGGTLTISAEEPGSGSYGFSKSKLTAKAGSVKLQLDNPGSDKAPHAIAIEGNGVDASGSIAQPGAKSTVTAKLKAGTYTFYCPVGDHREEGMEGKLTVQ